MKFGIFMFPTDYSIGPVELARAVEERGFESLFFPEHTHIPASRLSPWPGGGELPKEYSHSLDPFVALTAAAGATKTLKVATGICLVMERDPIVLAKEVATLDLVSQGRFMLGVGGGWNREEMENHGTVYSKRFKRLRESVEAMKAIWTEEEATYHGEFVNFDRIWSWPKPTQTPHPPVIVGGDGERTLERVIRYGDEWMPIGMRDTSSLSARISELRTMAAEAGRGHIPVGLFGHKAIKEDVENSAEMGVERIVFQVRSEESGKVLNRLDQLAELVAAC